MDARQAALESWLETALSGQDFNLSTASADASFRRYFRVHVDTGTLIAMDAPPEHENCAPFVDIAARLRKAGLPAPDVLAQDLEQGFLLLTDLGRQTLLEVMTPDNADAWFAGAITALVQMQQRTTCDGLPDYDTALLQRELSLYPQWYLGKHAGITLSTTEMRTWDAACERLIDAARSQPQVFVHRDYMPRNLMVPADSSRTLPGIIDFQDAVRGPVTYDLVSLFRDAFVSWPEERIAGWVAQYREQATAAGVAFPDNLERAMDWMGMQRHLKVIGIFARLHYRDGKAKYLAETPRFHQYLYSVAEKYPEFDDLVHLVKRYEVDS
jgi:hypothetical protein